jgi:hypothetical protein
VLHQRLSFHQSVVGHPRWPAHAPWPQHDRKYPRGVELRSSRFAGMVLYPSIFYSIRWLTRRSNNDAFCCEGAQSQSRCLASLQRLALTNQLIQMASSTLALTASSCDSLFIQCSCLSCSGCLTRSRKRARRGMSCLVLPVVDEILSHRLHATLGGRFL